MGPKPVSFYPEPRPASLLLPDALLKMYVGGADDMFYR